MNIKKTNRNDVRSVNFVVKFSPTEVAEMEKAAKEIGITKSTLARIAIKEYLNKKEVK